jgi:hypothetical protein
MVNEVGGGVVIFGGLGAYSLEGVTQLPTLSRIKASSFSKYSKELGSKSWQALVEITVTGPKVTSEIIYFRGVERAICGALAIGPRGLARPV